jgi:putative sporulation protein YtaF
MMIGLTVVKVLPQRLANIIGGVLLIAMGVWIVKDFFIKRAKKAPDDQTETNLSNCNQILEEPERADSDHSGTIDLKEALFLALALTINNLGLGIGASITGLNIFTTVACTFIFSLLSNPLGCHIGEKCVSTFLGRYASLVSGLIIILMSLYEMFI